MFTEFHVSATKECVMLSAAISTGIEFASLFGQMHMQHLVHRSRFCSCSNLCFEVMQVLHSLLKCSSLQNKQFFGLATCFVEYNIFYMGYLLVPDGLLVATWVTVLYSKLVGCDWALRCLLSLQYGLWLLPSEEFFSSTFVLSGTMLLTDWLAMRWLITSSCNGVKYLDN